MTKTFEGHVAHRIGQFIQMPDGTWKIEGVTDKQCGTDYREFVITLHSTEILGVAEREALEIKHH